MRSQHSKRKYLTGLERENFIATAKNRSLDIYLMCRILHETGARISEVLNVQPDHIDFNDHCLFIECLKKRRRGVFRRIPLSAKIIELLSQYIAEKNIQKDTCLWGWSRMTAYRIVNQVSLDAGISPAQASPKALRHAFAVSAIEAGIPLSLIQRWLGHADLKTTTIYADLVGNEERSQASRLWCFEQDSAIFDEVAVDSTNRPLLGINLGSNKKIESKVDEHYSSERSIAAISNRVSFQTDTGLEHERKLEIEYYIKENLNDPTLTIPYLIIKFGVSRSSLYRMFRLEDGVARYINKRRLDAALTLLSSAALREAGGLGTMFDQFGFRSQRSFSQAFFLQFGLQLGKVERSRH